MGVVIGMVVAAVHWSCSFTVCMDPCCSAGSASLAAADSCSSVHGLTRIMYVKGDIKGGREMKQRRKERKNK
jgi:hypothetical protein